MEIVGLRLVLLDLSDDLCGLLSLAKVDQVALLNEKILVSVLDEGKDGKVDTCENMSGTGLVHERSMNEPRKGMHGGSVVARSAR